MECVREATCTSATISGSGASAVISQAAPTFWIHVPRLEARLAIQSARNIGRRSGAQGSARRGSRTASEETAIAPDDRTRRTRRSVESR